MNRDEETEGGENAFQGQDNYATQAHLSAQRKEVNERFQRIGTRIEDQFEDVTTQGASKIIANTQDHRAKREPDSWTMMKHLV